MDILLNFKNKHYEAQYFESIDPYLSKIVKTTVIITLVIAPFLPYNQYLLYHAGNIPLNIYIQNNITTISLHTMYALIALFICKKREMLGRHQKATRWSFDIFFTLVAGYYTFQFYDFNKIGDPLADYVNGWFQCFVAVTVFSPISRWYLKISSFLAVILRIGIGVYTTDGSILLFMKTFQMVLLQFLVTYFHEKDDRKYFMEKQSLYEETKLYKEIFDLTSDGVLIYGLREGMLFRNWKNEKYIWWQNNEDCKQNFEKISLKECKQIAQLPSNLDIDLSSLCQAPNQTNFWEFLEHLIQQLSINLITTQNPISNSIPTNSTAQSFKQGNLVFLTGIVQSGTTFPSIDPTTYVIEIKILFTFFRGKPAVALVFSDITERTLVTVLQETNNYKNRLLASVSHELRTPLNASINFTQAAIDHPKLSAFSDIRENYLMPALRSNQLLLHLINDILDFSQMSVNKLRLVFENKNIHDTLGECVNLIKIQATRKGLRIHTDFKFNNEDDELFCTDHNRLKQIVLNLLSNALKFTLEGEIRITAELDQLKNKTSNSQSDIFAVGKATLETHQAKEEGGTKRTGQEKREQKILRISVRDTGIGISEDNKGKLFKAFEKLELGDRTSLNSQGVGLGLVISNNLVLMLGPSKQNNGIDVDSQENVGSTFSFWILDRLELKEEDNHSSSRPEDNCTDMEENPEQGEGEERLETLSNLIPLKCIDTVMLARKKPLEVTNPRISSSPIINLVKAPQILVVDDDVFNISAMSMILQKFGYTCDIAYNGKQAIQKILERQPSDQIVSGKAKQYKLVFMDCNMPVMGGFEASKILKTKMKAGEIEAIPIVICTAFITEKEKHLIRELGIDAYCLKPLNQQRISALVKKFCF